MTPEPLPIRLEGRRVRRAAPGVPGDAVSAGSPVTIGLDALDGRASGLRDRGVRRDPADPERPDQSGSRWSPPAAR